MKLMREETFGPIMPIMKVRDEDEAVRLANDSDFGLGASVWSRNLKRAERVAHQLEAGTTNINDTIVHYAVPLLPFGGVRLSGNARTHGRQDVVQFTRDRSFAVGGPPLPFDLATRMRSPDNYKLAANIMRAAYGVKPRQRLQPIAEGVAFLQRNKAAQRKATTAAGALLAAAAALVFGLRRARR
jgi:succinate-semialdehyde dehydrogenase/glutarate-semialdehyde dehydrogenase